jgi:hypothetical protein
MINGYSLWMQTIEYPEGIYRSLKTYLIIKSPSIWNKTRKDLMEWF